VDVRVIVFDGPQRLSCGLVWGVNFTHADGRPDNSYLPGVPSPGASTPYPIDLAMGIVVPVGTPEDNSFITPGSRLTSLRLNLFCREGDRGNAPGLIATYPLID
jgi:hypothetical protein